ncbi:hypothetical protein DL771_005707 [Monosporascus sp. 5C6A]|nr:hypothetical protein DL771_005707 [Monosporascus sp. 5C6A]
MASEQGRDVHFPVENIKAHLDSNAPKGDWKKPKRIANLASNGGYLDGVWFTVHTTVQDNAEWLENLAATETGYKFVDLGDCRTGHYGCMWEYAVAGDMLHIKIDDEIGSGNTARGDPPAPAGPAPALGSQSGETWRPADMGLYSSDSTKDIPAEESESNKKTPATWHHLGLQPAAQHRDEPDVAVPLGTGDRLQVPATSSSDEDDDGKNFNIDFFDGKGSNIGPHVRAGLRQGGQCRVEVNDTSAAWRRAARRHAVRAVQPELRNDPGDATCGTRRSCRGRSRGDWGGPFVIGTRAAAGHHSSFTRRDGTERTDLPDRWRALAGELACDASRGSGPKPPLDGRRPGFWGRRSRLWDDFVLVGC